MPARHHGPIRELLANNIRGLCHLQLLPLQKGLTLFLLYKADMNDMKDRAVCLFIMTWVYNENLKEDSLRSRPRTDAHLMLEVVSNAGISWLLSVHSFC